MKEHNIQLTSAEIGSLWSNYMTDSSALPVLKYFNAVVEDSEIKPLIEKAITISKSHINQVTDIFKQADYPIPIGFSDSDVDLNAPRLYSDTYMLYFLRNMGKSGIAAYGMAFSTAARKDVREFFSHAINESIKIEDTAKEIMLSKGLFVRPPYINIPDTIDFVEKQSFMRGWFGERRTLTAEEITHIFMNFTNNAYGKALLTGFAQVAESEELRRFFSRGVELAREIMKQYRTLLEESSLPSPMTWDTDVNNSTVSPFSDKLMLFQTSALNAISLGNIGGSLALSLRRDLVLKYLKQLKDIGLYAEDAANILIKNGWFERPPQAIDREYLVKGKKK
ncbi:DUF3231 family protein [Aquibacillus kalidii]|uniref:DUF3231 family protein n=1 Tax=Aquibacillus kalidii TaxID=2762597 RepID=UPI001648B399|nr:DUF3231 family protein [Aquibacillus kalidii]